MQFLLAVLVLTFVGAHATSDIVVKVEEEELSPLLRSILLKYLQTPMGDLTQTCRDTQGTLTDT